MRVLVTGSSRGIGSAIARKLASTGWEVGIHYSCSEASAQELAAELGRGCFGTFAADLSNPAEARRLITEVVDSGELHGLVNNAGVYLPLNFLESSDDEFADNVQSTMSINFQSPLWLMREAARYFARGSGGKILNVASRVGFRGEAGAALYAASKAGLINLTRSLAVDLAPRNIGVFGIAPGWVETAMAREGMETRKPEILASIPLGRIATPDDCANACAFLLSEEASYLSGVVIDINGASYFH